MKHLLFSALVASCLWVTSCVMQVDPLPENQLEIISDDYIRPSLQACVDYNKSLSVQIAAAPLLENGFQQVEDIPLGRGQRFAREFPQSLIGREGAKITTSFVTVGQRCHSHFPGAAGIDEVRIVMLEVMISSGFVLTKEPRKGFSYWTNGSLNILVVANSRSNGIEVQISR